MTTVEYINKARQCHGDKYDYSKVIYTGCNNLILIGCKKHGFFYQLPCVHVRKKASGCKLCRNESISKKKRLNQEEFLDHAKKIHGDKYNYDKRIYTSAKDKIIIVCNKHGKFIQKAANHLGGSGCYKCAEENKIKNLSKTTQFFIEKATKIHGDRYDYSQAHYKSMHDEINIICKKHGIFKQNSSSHLYGQGCHKCYKQNRVGKRAEKEGNKFIMRAIRKHGNKYDYSKVKYVNSGSKVLIICNDCGNEFYQSPSNHLVAFGGCQICFIKKLIKSKDDFIKDANKMHNNRYDYSQMKYIDFQTVVKIKCKKHGPFYQKASKHAHGNGCPSCSSSRGQLIIENLLNNNNVSFIKQKKFNDCKYKSLLRFDFYLPQKNICIQYDGIQHFQPVNFGNFSKNGTQQQLDYIKLKDSIKNDYCYKNNIKLIRIPYTKINNIENILKEDVLCQKKIQNFIK